MKRTVTYKGIKEVVYVLSQYQIRDMAINDIENSDLYIHPKNKCEYSIEWLYDDQDEFDGIKVTQKIIETESTDR